MTSIGFLCLVFGIVLLNLSDSEFLDSVFGILSLSGMTMMVAGIAIKLWEVMP